MGETQWKRPWLAVLLGALVTGLGHLYLRRWWRALGWLLATTVTSILFVPSSTMTTIASQLLNPGTVSVPIKDVLPLLVVGIVSVLDAYVIARTNNRQLMEQYRGIQRCHSCGRKIDPDVSFCQWCGTSLQNLNHDHDHDQDQDLNHDQR